MKSSKLFNTTAILLASLVAQPGLVSAQQNNNAAKSENKGNGGDSDSNENENSNENSGSGNNNAGGNNNNSGQGNNNAGGNSKNSNAGPGNNNAGGVGKGRGRSSSMIPSVPAGQTSSSATEANPVSQLIQTGTVKDLNSIKNVSRDHAKKIVEAAGGDLRALANFVKKFGNFDDLVEHAGGSLDQLVDNLDQAEDLDAAEELIGESADLINQIFKDITITTGALDTAQLFDRSRLFSNEFNTGMISLAADFSGNAVIGKAIEDAVNAGNLSETNSWEGALTEVLSNSSNLDILGSRSHEIGGLLDLSTDDFEAFVGKDVTIEAGSQVDLSSHGTKVLAIAGGDDLHVAGDVTFSDRASSWDKETLAIGAADNLTIADGSTVEYKGNYLGLGASSNVNLVNVTVKSGSGVGVGSLGDVRISNSTMELTNSRGGFGFYADNLLDIDGLAFAGPVEYIYMEATTINLKDINFPAGSSIDMVSELGPINGKYPNFGASAPGRVNFISGVSYGGEANVMDNEASFDQHGQNIKIMGF
jgi:hypothetical protein